MKALTFALGTRPEIIKLAPLIRRAVQQKIPFTLVHTGQHYDETLDAIFFQELSLPAPTVHLHAAGASHGEMFAKMFTGFEAVWQKKHPTVVIVQGDANSTFAAAFSAQRLGVPVAHVEAGLRSDDFSMPEEMNRVLTDHIADRLYAPTEEHAARLRHEGIADEKILVTGNTVADAVREHREHVAHTPVPPALQDDLQKPFALLTLHRPALVDDAARLQNVLHSIDASLSSHGLIGMFLVHPRTRKQLQSEKWLFPSIVLHTPVGYFPMLQMLQKARMVITDSGGLQEECALLHIPCITVRENTERPETLRGGGNTLVGFHAQAIQSAIEEYAQARIDWKPVYTIDYPSDMIFNDLCSRYLT